MGNHTIYLRLIEPIKASPSGHLLSGYLAAALGLGPLQMPSFTNAALADVPHANLYLTPEGLAYNSRVLLTPEDAVTQAILAGRQLQNVRDSPLKFDPNQVGFNVRDVSAIDALAIGSRLQTLLFHGGNYAYNGAILYLGTETATSEIQAVKIPHSGQAIPAKTLDDLLARIKETRPEIQPIHS